MIHLKLSLLLGSYFREIKEGLNNFEELYLGLFINELVYKDEKEGKKIKKQFYSKSSTAIKKINENIKNFNQIVKHINIGIPTIEIIKLNQIKIVIEKHKGDYPRGKNWTDDTLGKGDSASVLSRRYTALLIHNLLTPCRISMSDFAKGIDNFLAPFKSIDSKKLRKGTLDEVDRIEAIYSIGGLAEAIFMIGRLLEATLTQYLLLLKKRKLIDLPIKLIKSADYTLDNKIDYLYSKKKISPSEFSKMKSVKWDRNLYGHNIRKKPKDANAMVVIGLNGIQFLEKKLKEKK